MQSEFKTIYKVLQIFYSQLSNQINRKINTCRQGRK